jgi:ATP-binding cassette subfamily F protein 3
MSNLLQIQKGQKAYGKKHLFTDATFSINEGEHVGVIGPNGAGKSTLFKAIVGTEELDSGDIIRSRNLRLEYLGQEEHVLPTTQLEDFISEHSVKPLWKLKEIAIGFGFLEEDFYRGVDTFSGGYQMRARLLRILAAEPNLLLLDEPTNYLDLETLLVLENLMQGFEGAFLVISHDREFLRRVTDHTLEIEMGEVTKFPGNIDDYFEEKALLREQLEKRAMSLDAKRNAVLDFAARFGAKASKARQAQSRLKSLDKMEKIELRALPVSARIKLPFAQASK